MILVELAPNDICLAQFSFVFLGIDVQKLIEQSRESAIILDETTAKGQKFEREAEDAIKGWTRAQSDLDELKRENMRLLDVSTFIR